MSCRKPNNVKLYADYKNKGFEILGVSFDDNREAWVNAINQEGLTRTQVSDLKGWNSAAGKLYGVSAIPHTVLLDKNGIIIAKNLRDDKLREKVSQLLDSNYLTFFGKAAYLNKKCCFFYIYFEKYLYSVTYITIQL